MKKTTLIAIALSACVAFTATSLPAQEKPAPSAEGGGHSHFTKIPETAELIWKEIQKQQSKLTDVVAKKDLGEAHDHAFAIRDLVKALPAKVPAESKTKTEKAAKEIAKIAADIDRSGAAEAQKATEANVKKLETAIAALRKSLNAK